MTIAEAFRYTYQRRPERERLFDPDVVKLLCRPNLSPVTSRRTFVDYDGSECDYTTHEDGTVTVVAQRLAP